MAVVQFLLLILTLGAALAAIHRFRHRRRHPLFVHHSIGFTVVAIVAGVSLLFFGPP